jgi:hypothetical protein
MAVTQPRLGGAAAVLAAAAVWHRAERDGALDAARRAATALAVAASARARELGRLVDQQRVRS